MRKFYCFLILFLALFTQKISAAETDLAMQKEILFYINEYRIKHHLNPLKMNSLMSEQAAKHSREMASKAVPFGHKYFDKRIQRLFAEIGNCKGGAENVAYNYKSAKSVVANWLTSRGHRKNIEGNYNLTGIGLARDSSGSLYFTQIFIRTSKPA